MTTGSSAVQRLRAAADKLRKHAGDARSDDWGHRPWQTEECDDKEEGSCACIVSQGEYQPFDRAQVPPIQYIADAELTVHAAWIALMHPGVGEALAVVFDKWARMGELDPDLLNRVGGPETVALAGLILGTPAGEGDAR